MIAKKYLCPRCRAEGLSHDCAQPGKDFELHATLTFPVPLYTYGLQPADGLAAELTDRFMSDPRELADALKDVMELGDYEIRIAPVFIDPA